MKRYPYFPAGDGLACRVAGILEQLQIIARRYIGDNPPLPFTMRAMPRNYFRQDPGGRYRIDLAEKLGSNTHGYAIAACKLNIPVPKEVYLSIACLGPCKLWLNGEMLYSSTFEDEIHVEWSHRLQTTLPEGESILVLLCRQTVAGFGCLLGLPPVTPCSPLPWENGMAGWAWTELLPEITTEMTSGRLEQLLELPWRHAEFTSMPSASHVLWTRALGLEGTQMKLPLTCRGNVDCYVNGKWLQSCQEGVHTLSIPFHGPMNVHLVGDCQIGTQESLLQPIPVQGRKEPWLWAPMEESETFDYKRYTSPVDAPWQDVRVFYEGAFGDIWWIKTGNSAYGSWNYPMGVTLQGLLRAADVTGSSEIRDYVLSHMEQSLSCYEYACRDVEQYGATNINPELVTHANLDQFGSMGAAMLECAGHGLNLQVDRLAEEFYAFIRHKLPKLSDGTFCRRGGGPHDVDTIWADDLYMGTSFLIRYWKRYGAQEALDLAADQFIHYTELLLLPGNVLSHVYDLTRNKKTGVPWGRGNGWALFSLSELLEILPKEHAKREELLEIFCRLSDGYAVLQDDKGYWHQVLTDASSYEETSCTAMFTYAMCKGLRYGWYKDREGFLACALKGWKAISTYSVDKDGNVHAVCKGSGFSFTEEYYREELFWITNDNHGVGIVLLAGSEMERLLGNGRHFATSVLY